MKIKTETKIRLASKYSSKQTMHKITKDKNKIQTGAAINKQLERANDATSQMYPPKVGKLIPVRPASHFKCQNAAYN